MTFQIHAGPTTLALVCALAATACSRTQEKAGPAPVDSGVQTGADTAIADDTVSEQDRGDTISLPGDSGGVRPDTSVATPPINPAPSAAGGDSGQRGQTPAPTGPAAQGNGAKLSQLEYEGWRQYSVNCARCHGQDVLPNPVAANLLISAAPGGPMESYEKFAQVVSEGSPARGMPAFKSIVSPEQIRAIYAYVKGRAEKRIPPGRPASPGA